MAKRQSNFVLALMGAASTLALMTTTASAADAADAGQAMGQIEEIVVSATKRGLESMQSVPIAMQAISGDSLRQSGALEFDDFFRQVPGLSVEDQGAGDKRYVIRGINAVGAGTVGIYLDEVIITGGNAQDGGGRQPDVKLFDMERVEVLKGPQGSTFGSSSMSGTIRYITAKPNLDEMQGRVTGSVRDTKGADLGTQLEAMINVPVVEGKFAIRAAGFYINQPGFIDNRFGDGVNNDETKAGRLSARFAITDELTFTGMVMLQDQQADARSYYYAVDYANQPIGRDFYQADLTRADWNDEMRMYNGTLEYAPDYGTFTASYSRFERDNTYNRDSSLAMQAYLNLPADGAGRSIITQPKEQANDSYELRFASDWDSRFQILIGGFYQKQDVHFESYIHSANAQGFIDANPFTFLGREVDTAIKEKAIFAELAVDVTDALKITLGGRWYDFKIREESNATVSFGGGVGAGLGPVQRFNDDGVIGKLNISYDISDDVMTYAQVSEGFRAGGVNDQTAAQIANVVIPQGFGSDSLINYEAGVKSAFLDNRLIVNAAAYYIDWSDIQLQNQATSGTVSFPYTGNGGGAAIKGVEFEVKARPAMGLVVGFAANYTSAKLSEDNPIAATGRDGDRIPFVPKWTLAADAQYEWDLGWKDVEAYAGGDVTYTSSRATELRPVDPLYRTLDSYWLVNLRAGVRKDDWSVDLSVRNLFDDNTTIGIFRVIDGLYPDGYIPNRPRTISLTFDKRF